VSLYAENYSRITSTRPVYVELLHAFLIFKDPLKVTTDNHLIFSCDNQIFMLFLSFTPRWKIFGVYYKAVRTYEFYFLVTSVNLCSVVPNSTPPRLVSSQMFSFQPVGEFNKFSVILFSVIFYPEATWHDENLVNVPLFHFIVSKLYLNSVGCLPASPALIDSSTPELY